MRYFLTISITILLFASTINLHGSKTVPLDFDSLGCGTYNMMGILKKKGHDFYFVLYPKGASVDEPLKKRHLKIVETAIPRTRLARWLNMPLTAEIEINNDSRTKERVGFKGIKAPAKPYEMYDPTRAIVLSKKHDCKKGGSTK